MLGDDTDPMVTVMKLEKAPQETYADIGGLDQQIQEIKVHLYQTKYSSFLCSYILIFAFSFLPGISRITINTSRIL